MTSVSRACLTCTRVITIHQIKTRNENNMNETGKIMSRKASVEIRKRVAFTSINVIH